MVPRAAPAFLGGRRTLQRPLQPPGWGGGGAWTFPVTLLDACSRCHFGTFKLCFSLRFPPKCDNQQPPCRKYHVSSRKEQKKEETRESEEDQVFLHLAADHKNKKKSSPWRCQHRSAPHLLQVQRFYHHLKVVESCKLHPFWNYMHAWHSTQNCKQVPNSHPANSR